MNTGAGSFTITNGRDFTSAGSFGNAGQIRIGPTSTLMAPGNYVQTGGATILETGTFAAALMNIQAGVLTGNGTVTSPVSSAGSVRPGLSPGQIIVSGTYAQTGAGDLTIEIGGSTAGSGYDRLNVSASATLNGALKVSLINGYDPPVAATFDVLIAGSIANTFASTQLPALSGGRCWNVAYSASTVRLSVHSQPNFNQNPTSQVVCLNAPVTLSASANGFPAPTYQWRKGGANIPGATGSTFQIESFKATDAGTYDVVATNGCGPVASNPAVLTLEKTAPVISTCPGNQSLSANAGCQAAMPNLKPGVVASDNCDPNPMVSQSVAPGTLIGLGDTAVTMTVADNAGNKSTCQVTVKVTDTTPPSLTCPDVTMLDANATCQAMVPDLTTGAQASDNCSVTMTQDIPAGTIIGLGKTVVVLTAQDAAGLVTTCQAVLMVGDTDADGDGIFDCRDLCPNTVPGATIDASGCPPEIRFDFDRDGDVDDTDLNQFSACATGPAILGPPESGCTQAQFTAADFDKDGDVDQDDFGIFQRCYGGANKPADPNCAT